MARFIKKPKDEIGISPDELFFRGEKKVDEVALGIIDFDANNVTEDTIKTVQQVFGNMIHKLLLKGR